jgi:hypothetical protein
MARFVKRLLGFAAGAGVLSVALVYLFGPHAPVQAAFDKYKAAYLAGDVGQVARLTSSRDIAFWDEQRRHALTSKAETVNALDYKSRAAVFKLRSDVLDGKVALADLQVFSPEELYAATRESAAFGKALAQTSVLFAVPTGSRSARGYLRLVQLEGYSAMQPVFALISGAYVGFEKSLDGLYKTDPTPLLDRAAREAESLAHRVEHSGNKFLVQGFLRSSKVGREEELWEPLIKE